MSVILSEPLELDGFLYPAGVPVEISPASVAERLCLNGKAVPADVETADAVAACTLGDAVVPPPAAIAELAVAPTPDPEVEPEAEVEAPAPDPVPLTDDEVKAKLTEAGVPFADDATSEVLAALLTEHEAKVTADAEAQKAAQGTGE